MTATTSQNTARPRWRRENLRRRAWLEEGLQLVKLPNPGLRGSPTDNYLLIFPESGQVMSPTLRGLDDVAAWLTLDANTRRKRMRQLVAVR